MPRPQSEVIETIETPSVDLFADAARAWCSWAEETEESDHATCARACLAGLCRLVGLAAALPEPEGELEDIELGPIEVPRRRFWSLPVSCYGLVFDPLVVPPSEPVLGDLSDDCEDIPSDSPGFLLRTRMPQISGTSSLLRCSPMGDMGSAARRLEAPDLKRPPGPRDEIPVTQPGYKELKRCLLHDAQGRRALAVWTWRFGFHHHWGRHATGAIRALAAFIGRG